jgi:hypothetical protein
MPLRSASMSQPFCRFHLRAKPNALRASRMRSRPLNASDRARATALTDHPDPAGPAPSGIP